MKTIVETCYMCDAPAQSREHAPPRCLFPESKDVSDGRDYRKSLITVPSCDDHNCSKSKDDEYLLHILSGSLTSNHVGINQFLSKAKRAMERSPAIAVQLGSTAAPVRIHDIEKDEWIEAWALTIDGGRVDSVLEKCARALYFHTYGEKFFGEVKVITAFSLRKDDPSINERISDAFEHAERFFASVASRGENPEVFSFKLDRNERSAVVLMEFYGTSKALVRMAGR